MKTTKDRVAFQLAGLLEDAGQPGFMVRTDDLMRAGIPRRYADRISRQTRDANTSEAIAALVEAASETIAADIDKYDGLSPAELAATIPRL